jgi:hypothetical protein
MPASIDAVFATVIEELGQHPLPDLTKVREQVYILFGRAEAALARRCSTPSTSREEDIVVGVLRCERLPMIPSNPPRLHSLTIPAGKPS